MDFEDSNLQAVREDRLIIDRFDNWLFEEFESYVGQRIIEIGCGHGNLLFHLQNRGFVVGIENSPDSVKVAKHRFSSLDNINIVECSITDIKSLIPLEEKFDTAISLNVFEHIKDDDLAIRNTWKLLQPGGVFILIVPAHNWLYGTMDRSIGHYRRYTKTTVLNKFRQSNFRTIHCRYLNMIGALGWLVNGRILKKTIPPKGQLRAFNHLVPYIKIVEDKINSPFGISLMIIAKKQL